MACCILHQHSARTFGHLNLALARPGKLRQAERGAGLVGCNFWSTRFRRAGLRVDRIFAAWFYRSIGPCGPYCRSHPSRPLFDNRGTSSYSNVAAYSFPLANVYRSELADILALRGTRRGSVLSAPKLNPGSAYSATGAGGALLPFGLIFLV